MRNTELANLFKNQTKEAVLIIDFLEKLEMVQEIFGAMCVVNGAAFKAYEAFYKTVQKLDGFGRKTVQELFKYITETDLVSVSVLTEDTLTDLAFNVYDYQCTIDRYANGICGKRTTGRYNVGLCGKINILRGGN